MNPTDTDTARAALRDQRRAERARRIRTIRRGVVASGLAVFLASWGVVYSQGTAGTASSAQAGAIAAQVDTSTTQPVSSSSSATVSSGNTSSAPASQVSAVTTQQS